MFERIRSMFRKESATGRAVYMASGKTANWSQRNNKAFAEEGYQKNVIAYQAINKISNAIAAIPWTLFRGETELDQHPMLALLARPNPMQSGAEFMRAAVGFYMITGNAYLERVMVGSQPREIYTLRPDRMKVKPGEGGIPSAYVFQISNQTPEIWECDRGTGLCDIRHIKSFNPLDDWYGMSPLMAGAYAVDQHNESMTWMQALLQNSAMPSGALEMSAEATIGDDEFQRLKAEIDEQYSGAKNAGRPMLLEGGLKWTQMGLSPDDMKVIENKYSSARDVSLALGVPPLLLNIPGDSTFNNYQEARLAFYEETVIPLAHMIRDELNVWLAPLYGDNVRVETDLDKVPAIAEKRRELWTMANESDDLTINERRELKGFGPIPGGDSVMVQSSLLPLDFSDGVELSGSDARDIKALAYGETPDKSE